MPVRRLKDEATFAHPVRTFLEGLVGTVNGADRALADFDRLARRMMEAEAVLSRLQEVAGEAAHVLASDGIGEA